MDDPMTRNLAARRAVARRAAAAEAERRAAAAEAEVRRVVPVWVVDYVALETARLDGRQTPIESDFSIAIDAFEVVIILNRSYDTSRAFGLVRQLFHLAEEEVALSITRGRRGDGGVPSDDVRARVEESSRDRARFSMPGWLVAVPLVARQSARLRGSNTLNESDYQVAKDALDLTFLNGSLDTSRAILLLRAMWRVTECTINTTLRRQGAVGATSDDANLATIANPPPS